MLTNDYPCHQITIKSHPYYIKKTTNNNQKLGWDNCLEKKKQKVKPKKTLTKGTMLNIVEIVRGKALEMKKKILQNCVHYITKT